MKSLNDFINNQYISLAGLDKEVIEKLSNLNGQMINECDCGCCCCEPCSCDIPCECPGTSCNAMCEPDGCPPAPIDPIASVKSKFYTQPKVYDLLDTHTLLDYKYRFMSEYQRAMKEPVLFYDYIGVQYNDSAKLREDVLLLCEDFEFLWPVLLVKGDGTIQLFAAKKFGSNGEECSIKSSLIEAANILTKLEKRKEINWAQVLDVSIDNLDDLYDFLFTVSFNKEKYDKEIESKRVEDFKKIVSNGPSINTIG